MVPPNPPPRIAISNGSNVIGSLHELRRQRPGHDTGEQDDLLQVHSLQPHAPFVAAQGTVSKSLQVPRVEEYSRVGRPEPLAAGNPLSLHALH